MSPALSPADPFGDYTALTHTSPTPPPSSDDFEAPDFEPSPPESNGGIMGGLLTAGAARLIGIGVVIAVTTGGFGLLRGGVGTDGPPTYRGMCSTPAARPSWSLTRSVS